MNTPLNSKPLSWAYAAEAVCRSRGIPMPETGAGQIAINMGDVAIIIAGNDQQRSFDIWACAGDLPPGREEETLEAVLVASTMLGAASGCAIGLDSASQKLMFRLTLPLVDDESASVLNNAIDHAADQARRWKQLFESPQPSGQFATA